MKPIYYDFHIHSCLSPCANDDMTPANIVGMAAVAGLDAIAITDHNSCLNCEAAIHMGYEYGITVIPGMELCTKEEVHVVCLFEDLENALSFSRYVHEHMLPVKNKPTLFGNQYIYNKNDECIGEENILLITASDIEFDQVDTFMKQYHGVMIPAHLDKNSNSLLYNLGFIPESATFRCAELRSLNNLHRLAKQHTYLNRCRIITNSDAHTLEDINDAVNTIYVEELNVKKVLEALRNNEMTDIKG